MKKKILQFLFKHPKIALLISFLFFIFLIPGIALIKEDFSYRSWYKPDDPLLKSYDQFEVNFGNDDVALIMIQNSPNVFEPQLLKTIDNLTEKLWHVQGVERVDSLTNHYLLEYSGSSKSIDTLDVVKLYEQRDDKAYIDWVIEKFHESKQIKHHLVSGDGQMTLIKIKVLPSMSYHHNNEQFTNDIKNLLKNYPGLKYHLAGSIIIINHYKQISMKDFKTIFPLLLSMFVVFLFIIYRRISGVILPFFLLSMSVLAMMGVGGYFGEKLNTLSVAAPNILLTMCLADAIHILTVFFLGLKRGLSSFHALAYSAQKNFIPTFLTSITTMFGFFSFIPAKIASISMMGVDVGIGVMIAWFFTYFLLIPLMHLLFKVKTPDEEIDFNQIHLFDESNESRSEVGPWGIKLSNFISTFHLPIIIVSLVLMITGVFSFLKLEINMDPYTQFKSSHPLIVANEEAKKHIKSITPMEVMFTHSESVLNPDYIERIDSFRQWLLKQPEIERTVSYLDLLEDLNAKLDPDSKSPYPSDREAASQALFLYSLNLPQNKNPTNLIDISETKIRLTAFWTISNSKMANVMMDKVKKEIKRRNLNGMITGKMPLFHDLTPYVVSSFERSFYLAFFFIAILMMYVLNSKILGLLALVPNLFPVLTLAILYQKLNIHVDIASVMIASVVFGIAVDDSIHFLFEYQRLQKKKLKFNEILPVIVHTTYPSLFNTTLLIVMGFGSFYFASYIPNQKFGVSLAIALILALVADFFLLPAILKLKERLSS